jgi:FAD dependent oxidoreductase/Fumarylacetoacetate (FAA) hydrolase family
MKRRHQAVAEIEGQEFDVCVIGGGATGSGCALDSQLRGLNTVLVDTGDFAGKWFGNPNGGEMSFSFFELIEHVARTRNLRASTIIGSGTVSNADRKAGSGCISELRAIEMIGAGRAKTAFILVTMLKNMEPKQGRVFDDTNLRKEWAKACAKVELGTLAPVDKAGNRRYTGLIIHDLRRSAIKNLMKMGVNERVAMAIRTQDTCGV